MADDREGPLTVKFIDGLKAAGKPYRETDGIVPGLFLLVGATGTKSWQLRYRHDGKQQTASFGKYPVVGLAEARKRAQEARQHAHDGEHLTRHKRAIKARKTAAASNTFDVLAAAWLRSEAARKGWTESYIEEATASIDRHLSALKGIPVDQIKAAMTAPILERIERAAPAMEEKVWRRLYAIMDYAVTKGAVEQNPLPRRRAAKRAAKHFPAVVDLPGVGAILRVAAASDPCKGIRRAHVLLVYTAQRVSEVVGATWDEFDLDAGTWAIPRSRMKKKDKDRGDHVVPVPPVLLATLKQWKADDGGSSRFVCPAPRDANKPITPEACEKSYRDALDLGGKHSPHSWRSAFSTVCREAGKDRDVIESQLDHQTGNKTESAYDRAKRIELRRDLLAWYEATLVAARDGAAVIPLERRA